MSTNDLTTPTTVNPPSKHFYRSIFGARPYSLLLGLGWFPILSIINAVALIMCALAYNGGRLAQDWAEPLFWIALIILFVPSSLCLALPHITRHQRIAVILSLGLALYFVKALHSPSEFTFADEFMHWRTTQDILETQHLFTPNPLLPTSPLYPGMEIVTAALVNLTGLSIFSAALIQLALARFVLILSLYLFYEQVSRSAQVAGLATLLYMANPNFLFFDAQFAYETVALAMAVFVLYLFAQRLSSGVGIRIRLTFILLPAVCVTTIAHHVTSYALVGFLMLYGVVALVIKQRKSFLNSLRLLVQAPVGKLVRNTRLERFFSGMSQVQGQGVQSDPRSSRWLSLFGIVACLSWMAYAAHLIIIEYITPHIADGMNELLHLIANDGSGRQLFRTFSGQVAPPLERITAFASVALIMLALPFCLWLICRRFGGDVMKLSLALATLAYPVSLSLRLTQSGAEASNRASEFLFVALGLVLALGAVELWLTKEPSLRRLGLFTGWATVLFLGGVIIGNPVLSR